MKVDPENYIAWEDFLENVAAWQCEVCHLFHDSRKSTWPTLMIVAVPAPIEELQSSEVADVGAPFFTRRIVVCTKCAQEMDR